MSELTDEQVVERLARREGWTVKSCRGWYTIAFPGSQQICGVFDTETEATKDLISRLPYLTSRDALQPILEGLSDQERASLIGLLVGDYSLIELAMWRLLTIPARDVAHAIASILEDAR